MFYIQFLFFIKIELLYFYLNAMFEWAHKHLYVASHQKNQEEK